MVTSICITSWGRKLNELEEGSPFCSSYRVFALCPTQREWLCCLRSSCLCFSQPTSSHYICPSFHLYHHLCPKHNQGHFCSLSSIHAGEHEHMFASRTFWAAAVAPVCFPWLDGPHLPVVCSSSNGRQAFVGASWPEHSLKCNDRYLPAVWDHSLEMHWYSSVRHWHFSPLKYYC